MMRRPAARAYEAYTVAVAEWSFVVFSLLVLAGALIPLLQRMEGARIDVSVGDRTTQMLLLPIYLVAGAWIAANVRRFRLTIAGDPVILAVVALALASTIWSVEPAITLRRSIALLATTVFAAYLVARFDNAELVRLFASALGVAAVLSLVTVLLLPAYGLEWGRHAGSWRGIFANKNVLGRAMVLSTLCFLCMPPLRPSLRWVRWSGALFSAGLVLMSRSATALAVLAGCLALFPFLHLLRSPRRVLPLVLFAGGLLSTAALLLLLLEWQTILTLLGRDATLTGRTAIWLAVLERIADRPVLGFGFSAFWTDWRGEAASVWLAVFWTTPHAHNGFLDLWLELGGVGLVLAALGAIVILRRAVGIARVSHAPDGLWPVMMLVFMVLYNLSESAFVKQNSIFWVLYAATAFLVARRSAVAGRVPSRSGRARVDAPPVAPRQRPAPPAPWPGGFGVPDASPGVRLRLATRRGREA